MEYTHPAVLGIDRVNGLIQPRSAWGKASPGPGRAAYFPLVGAVSQ